MICPNCGYKCWRESCDVGVGVIYGPYGCPCGWSEDARYSQLDGPKTSEKGGILDQWGGLTPATNLTHVIMKNRPKPGPCWKHLAGSVWEHACGVRVHLAGLIKLPDGRMISANAYPESAVVAKLIVISGGNRRRGLLSWASGYLKIQG